MLVATLNARAGVTRAFRCREARWWPAAEASLPMAVGQHPPTIRIRQYGTRSLRTAPCLRIR